MSLGGTRVSSSFTLPLTEASVSVATFGGLSPTSGIVSAFFVVTCTCAGAATYVPPLLVTTSTAHGPFLSNAHLRLVDRRERVGLLGRLARTGSGPR